MSAKRKKRAAGFKAKGALDALRGAGDRPKIVGAIGHPFAAGEPVEGREARGLRSTVPLADGVGA
jgi:hypothetical protein